MVDSAYELVPMPPQIKEAEFANELEGHAFAAVLGSIQKAMELTEGGVRINGQPMITGLTIWHKFLDMTGGHETVRSPQLGMISEDDVFTTTRDGWAKFSTFPYGDATQHGLPKVKGVGEAGKRHIVIEPNNSSSEFRHAALPSGALQVHLYETGEIRIMDEWGSDERPASDNELNEIFEIFSAIYMKLRSIKPKGD